MEDVKDINSFSLTGMERWTLLHRLDRITPAGRTENRLLGEAFASSEGDWNYDKMTVNGGLSADLI